MVSYQTEGAEEKNDLTNYPEVLIGLQSEHDNRPASPGWKRL